MKKELFSIKTKLSYKVFHRRSICNRNEKKKCTPLLNSSVKTKPTSSPGNKSRKPIGFVNKGNACYANSILQALSTAPILWNKLPSEASMTSPISKAATLNMSIQKRATKPIDS